MEREQQVIWAAGFFDGEGCVCIIKPYSHTTHTLRLQVAQTKIEPLLRLRELWGGNIQAIKRQQLTHANAYLWVAASRLAERPLKEMLPYLLVKREQAQLGLEFIKLIRSRNDRRRLSHEELQTREAARWAMGELNAKGPRKPSMVPRQVKPEAIQFKLVV